MKAGWQTEKLGEVCSLLNRGISPKYTETGGIYVLNQKCIRDHRVSFEQARRHDLSAKSVSENRYIQPGDVLVNSTGTGTLGRVAQVRDVLKEPTTVDSHVTIVRPKQGKFYQDFFGYMLILIEEAIKEAGEGCGGQTELARSVLSEKFLVSYPTSIAEQQRIVVMLDQAFEGIAKARENAEQNLQNARALFESHLQSVFSVPGDGWEVKALGDVLQKTETVDPTKKPNVDFIYLDVSSVNKETKEIENVTVMLGKDAPSRARKLIRTNDVIFATVRPTHSRVALIPEEYNEQICSTGYFVLRAKEFINNNLILYFLLTPIFNKQMEMLQKGASYPAVTDSEVKSIMIHFPKSVAEQKTIVTKLDLLREETRHLETRYQRKIECLDELKKSLLQQAFAGEL